MTERGVPCTSPKLQAEWRRLDSIPRLVFPRLPLAACPAGGKVHGQHTFRRSRSDELGPNPKTPTGSSTRHPKRHGRVGLDGKSAAVCFNKRVGNPLDLVTLRRKSPQTTADARGTREFA